jgi:sensor histidine kinase regulating citrate/malate metabolism
MERQIVAEQIESLNLVDLTKLSAKDRSIIEDTRQTFMNVFYSRSLDVLEDILGESERLARDLNKDKPIIMIDDPGFSLTLEAQELFRNIFTHIIRNSLDHGIESPQERVKKGKRPSGKLELVLKERDGQLVLRYQDDGRGLNLRLLKDVGIRRGFLPKDQTVTREAIAELIFVGGLSTSADLTEISGRGVGMDAVKRYILQIGGDIRIWLDEKGEDAQGCCAFSLEIVIPGRLFSQVGESRKKVS